MISPFKAALGGDYKAFEDRLEAAIHVRFGLPATLGGDLKRIKRGRPDSTSHSDYNSLDVSG